MNLKWEDIAADESAPYWARDLARELPTKDPVDVLNVLEILVGVASRHLARVSDPSLRTMSADAARFHFAHPDDDEGR